MRKRRLGHPPNDARFGTILSFDPGGTTGYAIVSPIPETRTVLVREVGEFPAWDGVEELVGRVVGRGSVVYEDFLIKRLDVPGIALQVIGVIRFVSDRLGVPAESQPPSMRNSIDRMYGPDFAKVASHKGSAVRHAVVYCIRRLPGLVRPRVEFTEEAAGSFPAMARTGLTFAIE